MSPSLSLDFGRKEMGNVGDGEIFTRTISKNGIYLCSFKNGFDSLKKGRNK